MWHHQEREGEQQRVGEHKPQPTYTKKNTDIFNRKNNGFQKEDFQLNYRALRLPLHLQWSKTVHVNGKMCTHPTLSGLLCALVYPGPSVADTHLVQCLACGQGDSRSTAGETPERTSSVMGIDSTSTYQTDSTT